MATTAPLAARRPPAAIRTTRRPGGPGRGRAGPSLGATLERPSVALASRETGLHLWPHDSIGGVNERMAPLPRSRRLDARACDGRAAGAAGGLLAELEWRGILHGDDAGTAGPAGATRPSPATSASIRPADSLHVGHLVPIFGLLRLQRFGGRPVALVGGGTGMIGDPSGRSTERNLLDRETLERNVVGIRGQLERFLDFSSGRHGAVMVNNLDWLGELGSSTSCATPASTSRSRTCWTRIRSRCGWSADCRSPSSATCCCRPTTSPTCTGRWASSCRWAAPTSGATSPPASS